MCANTSNFTSYVDKIAKVGGIAQRRKGGNERGTLNPAMAGLNAELLRGTGHPPNRVEGVGTSSNAEGKNADDEEMSVRRCEQLGSLFFAWTRLD